jgi:small-conductance mechanosensitive channel
MFEVLDFLDPNLRFKLLQSLFAFAVFYVFRFFSQKYIIQKLKNSESRYRWQKALSITTNFLLVIFFLKIWFDAVGSLATYLGFLTAGLAIALKDLIANLAGSLFILSRHPFDIGDRIQIGTFRGDVIDIRLFQFSVMEIGEWTDADSTTGRIIHVPCGKIFSESLLNYNQAFSHIWNEISLRVTFETNWKKAKTILTKIVTNHQYQINSLTQNQLKESSLKFMLPIESFESKVFTTVEDSGVRFTIRYLCEPKQRRKTEVELWEEILEAFDKESDINFGYPTQRFYTSKDSVALVKGSLT